MTRRSTHLLLLLITLIAFALRTLHLAQIPPGWRVDELSNIFALALPIQNGYWRWFYPEASGQEVLSHAILAAMLKLFGLTAWGIRGQAVLAGTLALPLTYAVGTHLFQRKIGLLATATLALSFWSLMYSRFGLRQILTPFFLLTAMLFFWSWWHHPRRTTLFGFAASLTLGYYTYFAGWIVPLIFITFLGYLGLFSRADFRRIALPTLLAIGVSFLLAIPLLQQLLSRPNNSADPGRVSEVAKPIHALRQGEFAPLLDHIIRTFNMFHSDGDEEWLYNIPKRPIFAPPLALIFWLGVATAFYYALRRQSNYAFLLIWWFGGIGPSFISVPPGSLGHTIVAQPATYLLLGIGFFTLTRPLTRFGFAPTAVLACLLLVAMGWRDLPDYFAHWAQRGHVRFLYHAEAKSVADYLHNSADLTDFAISGTLAGPWEKLALQIDQPPHVRPRWYDQSRAIFLSPPVAFHGYPSPDEPFAHLFAPTAQAHIASYTLSHLAQSVSTPEPLTCWQNGLCLLSADYQLPLLDLTWQLRSPLQLPNQPIPSFPPVPNSDSGPRLHVFAHLQTVDGTWVTGDDGLWVDPQTLQVGDVFRQRHLLIPPETGPSADYLAIGLYDPQNGQRWRTTSDRDQWRILLTELGP